MKFWKRKVITTIPYKFSIKDEEFTVETKLTAKSTQFVDFFNNLTKKVKVKESWDDIKKDRWELDDNSKAQIEKKILKAVNLKGIIEKEKKNEPLKDLKVIYSKLDKVEYQKNGEGYDVFIVIKGLQVGVN